MAKNKLKKKAIKKKTKKIVKKIARKVKSTPNKSLNTMLGSVGETVGNLALPGIGGMAGKILAKGAHTLFKTITGYGDYKVKSNSLFNGDVPMFANKNPGNNRFVNREFICDVKGSQDFRRLLSQEKINPGNPNLFPWLSNVSSNFQEYILHGMIFQYKPTSGSAISSTNNALGTVIMGTQYNPYDQPFTNKQNMENTMYSTPGAPIEALIHPIECAKSQTTLTNLNVRNSTNSGSGQDSRFYDLGVFTLATIGMQADDITIGELHVSYDIEFLKPITPPTGSSDSQVHYTATQGITAATPFGTNPVLSSSSDPFPWITFNNANEIQFAREFYGSVLILMHIRIDINSTVNQALNTFTLYNCKFVTLWDSTTASGYVQTSGSSLNSTNLMISLQITGPDAKFKLVNSGTWTSCSFLDLVIVPLSLTD